MERIDLNKLRLLILGKYKNYSEFARSIGWKPAKANRIMRGEQELTETDINELADHLEIQSGELFIQIFFPMLSTKWTA